MLTLFLDIHYDGCTIAFVGMQKKTPHILGIEKLCFEPGQLNHIITTDLVSYVCCLAKKYDGPTQQPLSCITHIITTVGPASFTALRSGLSFLQGIAYGLGCPVLTLSRMEAMAVDYAMRDKKNASNVSVFLKNPRGGYFYEAFQIKKNNDTLYMTSNRLVTQVTSNTCDKNNIYKSDGLDVHQFVKSIIQYAHCKNTTQHWGDASHIQPFYGHTPTFKKRRHLLTV